MAVQQVVVFWAAFSGVLGAPPAPASGQHYVFLLDHGGRVVGQLLNPDQVPRETYEVETAEGVRITLKSSQVRRRIYQRPEKVAYEQIRPRYPDTVAGQWELAEWCRQRSLGPERERHLQRVLELDENHRQARRALGYSRIDGQWKTQEQAMKEQGYVWYDHGWRTQQYVKLHEATKGRRKAEGQWREKLGQWRRWLNGNRARMAAENIRSVQDPEAVKALAEALAEEKENEQRRLLFIEALAHIGTPAAMKVLAEWSLLDPVEEVGLTCLDYLKAANDHSAVDHYIGQLRSQDNARVNRAAVGLKHMGSPVAIPALIDALITTHKRKVTIGKPGSIGGSFGTGGGSPGGLSLGSKTIVLTNHVQNRAVLEALIQLSGGKNFGFDVARWKTWYAAQQRGGHLDARRN